MGRKKIFIAYLLLFFGGIFGLHLIYLGRDRQAILYWMTYGGCFGLGCLYDFFNMRYYIADANEEKWFIEKLAHEMKTYPKPVVTRMRFIVHMVAGDYLGHAVSNAIPYEMLDENLQRYAKLLIPLGVAIGVHLSGNIGRQQGKLIYPLIGAYLTFPLYIMGYELIFLSSILAVTAFDNYSKEWRRSPPKKGTKLKRVSVLLISGLICAGLLASSLYFNCQIVSEDGEEVKCRDAAKHFFTSPVWKEFKEVLADLIMLVREHGWKEVYKHIIEAFDPQGKQNALQVLGLDSSATEHDIASAYRKLSRKYHPDKHHDPIGKATAQAKFIEVQEAYGILSSMKAKRTARNVEPQS